MNALEAIKAREDFEASNLSRHYADQHHNEAAYLGANAQRGYTGARKVTLANAARKKQARVKTVYGGAAFNIIEDMNAARRIRRSGALRQQANIDAANETLSRLATAANATTSASPNMNNDVLSAAKTVENAVISGNPDQTYRALLFMSSVVTQAVSASAIDLPTTEQLLSALRTLMNTASFRNGNPASYQAADQMRKLLQGYYTNKNLTKNPSVRTFVLPSNESFTYNQIPADVTAASLPPGYAPPPMPSYPVIAPGTPGPATPGMPGSALPPGTSGSAPSAGRPDAAATPGISGSMQRVKGLWPKSGVSTGDPGQYFARRGETSQNTRLAVNPRDIGADPGQSARYSMGLAQRLFNRPSLGYTHTRRAVQTQISVDEPELNPGQAATPATGIQNIAETILREGRRAQVNNGGQVALSSAAIAMDADGATRGPGIGIVGTPVHKPKPESTMRFTPIDPRSPWRNLTDDLDAALGVPATPLPEDSATTATPAPVAQEQQEHRQIAVESGAVRPTATALGTPPRSTSGGVPMAEPPWGPYGQYRPGTRQRAVARTVAQHAGDYLVNVEMGGTPEQNPDVIGVGNRPGYIGPYPIGVARMARRARGLARGARDMVTSGLQRIFNRNMNEAEGQPLIVRRTGGGAYTGKRKRSVSAPVAKKFKDMTKRLGKL